MNIDRKAVRILISVLAILVLVLVLTPGQEGFLYYLIRGLVFIGVIWMIVLYSQSGKQKEIQKESQEPGDTGKSIVLDDRWSQELKDYYEELLDHLFLAIRSINPGYSGAVYMIDPTSNGYTLQKATGNEFLDFIPMDNEIIQSLMAHNEGMIFQQKDVREPWKQLFTEKTWRGSECLVGVRILYKNQAVGSLMMTIDHFSELQDRDRNLLVNLGEYLSLGMSKIEKIEDILTDCAYYSQITRLFGTLDLKMDEQTLLNSVRDLCQSIFNYDKLTISVRDKSGDGREAVTRLVDGFTEDIKTGSHFPIGSTIHGWPMERGEAIRTQYWEKSYPDLGRFRPGDTEEFSFMAILAVPMKIGDGIHGAIALERIRSQPYMESDQHLLELLSMMVGTVLTWMDEYDQVHQSAIHDGLTGLLNHKTFMERFTEEISRAVRFEQKLVVVVLDLDKFKRVNDTFGHIYGDYVLKTVANLMHEGVRNIDVVARYGGEEFAIILVNTETKRALPIAERIVKSIADYPYNYKGHSTRITISAGMVDFPKDSDQVKDLIEKADMAMYRTKGQGGNGVMVYQQVSDDKSQGTTDQTTQL